MADLGNSPELGLRPLRGSRSPGEVEEAAVSTFVGSSELGRWGNGGATEVKDRRRWRGGEEGDDRWGPGVSGGEREGVADGMREVKEKTYFAKYAIGAHGPGG